MDLRDKINKDGYLIIQNVFTSKEIDEFKAEIINYTKKKYKNIHAKSIIDPANKHPLPSIHKIINNNTINNVLMKIFDTTDYRFCGHNDIGIDRIVGWHKDKLNGIYSKYQRHDIWSSYQNEKHEILKVLVYLQNHKEKKDGLRIIPKSHLDRNITKNNSIHIDIEAGDILIFDQRITHRGPKNTGNTCRTLISVGFGKNNIFTDEFELGTQHRQKDKKYFECQKCSIKKRKKCLCKKKN